jgi:DNA-3-methyladenine glycosylase
MRPLQPDFYDRPVLEVAQGLIGCTLSHGETAGVIVETEAYHGSEPACHAFIGLTARTEPLFGTPGRAYVYRSYGIHALLNAVCEHEGVGAAVLIRALSPSAGVELMRRRRTRSGRAPIRDLELCSGPGKLTQALGVEMSDNRSSLTSGPVQIRARSGAWREPAIIAGARVGITRAAELPWRFSVAGDPHVSRPRPATDPAAERRLAARTPPAAR